jgi:dTDP-4-dehydrorhamnose 3,5-epimerase
VTGVSTEAYFADASAPVSPRPANSVLDLAKIEATGFETADQWGALDRYLAELQL